MEHLVNRSQDCNASMGRTYDNKRYLQRRKYSPAGRAEMVPGRQKVHELSNEKTPKTDLLIKAEAQTGPFRLAPISHVPL